MSLNPSVLNPTIGMLAIVRKRRGIVSDVKDFDSQSGRYHLVRIDYRDDAHPGSEELLWELETSKRLLEPSELPQTSSEPMTENDFDAMVRAARWTSINSYLDPDDKGPLERLPICSPFHGAVEVDSYQLVPLLKALSMPRVNLLLADDVGLGKTIEAGLILSELLIRRRVNRVLILTPAALRLQWRDEMWSKFSLPFDVVDSSYTMRLKRTLGIDANPWRSSSRVIASYHYLRQPDILEQFMSACRTPEGSPHLPWDLLIVDEVHNLMPASFGDDSQLCKMLQLIAPQFEHRLFLTATPHNGHTRSFTGLLELLDPVRFSRTDELKPAEQERIKQVVIRRLKREINERTNPPKFCTRKPPHALELDSIFGKEELNLIAMFETLRSKIRSVIKSSSKKRRLAGNFAIEILGKRMLSGPMTFLESWQRCKAGLVEDTAADDTDLVAAGKTTLEETADDREAQQRDVTASTVIGSWMKNLADSITEEMADIDRAATDLGVDLQKPVSSQTPLKDARFETLCVLINKFLRDGDHWKNDERLVLFTEYKTTLDYLLRRLREKYSGQDERFLCLFGGMDDGERELIKEAFNDPNANVRVLLATDAASEGLNLQSTARYLLHYDCPWNPSRLEQRNGRLDRHGQARDVYVFHFASEQDSDLKFMAFLIGKVDQIREDLGATGELFDEATHRRMIRGDAIETVQQALELQISEIQQTVVDDTISHGDSTGEKADLLEQIEALAQEIDFDAETARKTLDTAMSINMNSAQLTDSDDLCRFEIHNPSLAGWKDVIDETIRKQSSSRMLGPVPKLTFSPKAFLADIGGRTVFRPRVDTLMLHLGHPFIRKATGTLVRRRFPGPNAVSRWTLRYGGVPDHADALILLYLEEIGVNELRETFHHWIQTLAIPVVKGELQQSLPHQPARHYSGSAVSRNGSGAEVARDMLDNIEPDLQDFVKNWRKNLTKQLKTHLETDGKEALKREEERYRSRQAEVSTLIAENTLAKLEKDIAKLKKQRMQGVLFDNESFMENLERSIQMKQEEIDRRQKHYDEVRQQLSRERERIMKHLLPRRYALKGSAQVFPVAIEIRLPEGGRA